MSHCGCYTMSDRECHNLCDLPRAMEKHLPGLESFEYTRLIVDEGSPGPDKFDTFMKLKELRNLAVDVNMVRLPIKDSLSQLSDPYALFPKSLQNLTLNSFSMSRIHHLVSLFHQETGDVDDLGVTLSQALTYLASKFPLKSLSLGIDMDCECERYRRVTTMHVLELDSSDVLFFRYTADVLLRRGLRFEVSRLPGNFENFCKLLVGPGFTAPRPHPVNPYPDSIEEDDFDDM
jgi:hypothetical protein